MWWDVWMALVVDRFIDASSVNTISVSKLEGLAFALDSGASAGEKPASMVRAK